MVTRGIRLGEVADVIIDGSEPRILGLDVLCGDGANRFLPISTARLLQAGVEVESALTMLHPRELQFYRSQGRSLLKSGGALVGPHTARR